MNPLHNFDSEACSDVVIRRPKKSILTAKVSIPRVSIDNCEKFGHRLPKRSENQDSKKGYSRRPHSLHFGQDNYLYLQQINEVSSKNSYTHENLQLFVFYRLNLSICIIIGTLQRMGIDQENKDLGK
jgi:hypothetical protein